MIIELLVGICFLLFLIGVTYLIELSKKHKPEFTSFLFMFIFIAIVCFGIYVIGFIITKAVLK